MTAATVPLLCFRLIARSPSLRDGDRPVRFRGFLVALLGVSAFVVGAPVAHAATFVVSNTDDSGEGSLRQAIDDANDNAQVQTRLRST